MAILSNINGKFAVESSGAIQLSGSAGTSGYVLKSNGTGSAASWVDPTTIIGGPYLPLSGGTLTGATATASNIAFTVGGTFTVTGKFQTTSTGAQVTGSTFTVYHPSSATKLQFIQTNGNWKIEAGGGTNKLVFHSESLVEDYLTIKGGGQIQLNDYGSGSHTGTTAYTLAVDSSGNIIETTDGGGDITGSGTTNTVAKFTGAKAIGNGPVTFSGNDSTFAGNLSGSGSLNFALNTNAGYIHNFHNPNTGTSAYVELQIGENGNKELRIGSSSNYSAPEWNNSWIYAIGRDLALKSNSNVKIYSGGNLEADVALIADASQNVGIGRTDPNARLDIKGAGGSTGLTFETSDSSNNQTFYIQDGGRAGMQYYPFTIGMASGTSAASGARFQVANTGGDFVILNDGKTGIGTTSPSHALDVTSAAYDQVQWTRTSGVSGYLYSDSAGVGIYSGASFSNAGIYLVPNTSMDFRVNGSIRMFINSSGNVGIGTTATSLARLNVYDTTAGQGTSRVVDISNSVDANINIWLSQSGAATKYAEIASYSTIPLVLNNVSGGNVAIGTTGNHFGEKLRVQGWITSGSNSIVALMGENGIGAVMGAYSNHPLILRTNNTERMRIESTGVMKFPNTATSTGDVGTIAHYTNNYMYIKGGTGGLAIGDDGFDTNIYINNSDDIQFGTSGSTKMLINSSGNVGIGTTSPLRKLSVIKNTTITGGFNDISEFLDTTIGVGGSVSLNIGRANSTKNLGKMAFKYAGSGSNSNAINWGFYDADNLMTLLASGNLGIGKTNPGFALDVVGGIASTGTQVSTATSPLSWQGNGNTDTYTQTVIYSNQSNTSGIINNAAVFIERGRLTNSASGEIRHLIIGSRGGQSQFTFASEKLGINNDNPSAQLHLTANASNSVPFKLQGHNSTSVEQMLIYSGQSAGTGWYNIVAQAGGINQLIIYGNGNIQNANNSYGQISDERLKENIVDTTPKLEDIKKIKVKNFNFIGDDLKQIGMIAQEVEEVFPGLVEEIKQPDVEDVEGGTYKSIKYSVLVPILIKAIQELEARVKELENK